MPDIHVYIKDEKLFEWLNKQVADKKFRNSSHAVELALERLRDEWIKAEKKAAGLMGAL